MWPSLGLVRELCKYRSVSNMNCALVNAIHKSISQTDIVAATQETIDFLDRLGTRLNHDFIADFFPNTLWSCILADNLILVSRALSKEQNYLQIDWTMKEKVDMSNNMISTLLQIPDFVEYLAHLSIEHWKSQQLDAIQTQRMLQVILRIDYPEDEDALLAKIDYLKGQGADLDLGAIECPPEWLFKHFVLNDSQWNCTIDRLINTSRYDLDSRTTLANLLAIAHRQGRSNQFKRKLCDASSSDNVASEQYKEHIHALRTKYSSLQNSLRDRVFNAVVKTLEGNTLSLSRDWDPLIDSLATMPELEGIVASVFSESAVKSAILTGNTALLTNILPHIHVNAQSLLDCRPKNKATTAVLLEYIDAYAQTLGTYSHTLWPPLILHAQALLYGVLRRNNKKLDSVKDIERLLTNGATLPPAIIGIGYVLGKILPSCVLYLSREQINETIKHIDFQNNAEMTMLYMALFKLSQHILHNQEDSIASMKLFGMLMTLFDIFEVGTGTDDDGDAVYDHILFRTFVEQFRPRLMFNSGMNNSGEDNFEAIRIVAQKMSSHQSLQEWHESCVACWGDTHA